MASNPTPYTEITLEGIKRSVDRQIIRHPKTKEVTFVPDIVSITRSQYNALIEMAERGQNAQGT